MRADREGNGHGERQPRARGYGEVCLKVRVEEGGQGV